MDVAASISACRRHQFSNNLLFFIGRFRYFRVCKSATLARYTCAVSTPSQHGFAHSHSRHSPHFSANAWLCMTISLLLLLRVRPTVVAAVGSVRGGRSVRVGNVATCCVSCVRGGRMRLEMAFFCKNLYDDNRKYRQDKPHKDPLELAAASMNSGSPIAQAGAYESSDANCNANSDSSRKLSRFARCCRTCTFGIG